MKPAKDAPKVKADDFMCVCGPQSKARAEAVYNEAMRRLGTSPDKLLSTVVYSLHWELDAWIEGIGCDQWCGVSATGMGKGVLDTPVELDDDDPKKITSYIQCDIVEHGIAATWLYFAQLKDQDLAKHITRKGFIRRTKVRAIDPVSEDRAAIKDIYTFDPNEKASDLTTDERKQRNAERSQQYKQRRGQILEKYDITNEQLDVAAEYVRFYS